MGRYRLATISVASVLLVASMAGALVAFTPDVATANHAGPAYAVGQDGQCVAEVHPLGDGSQTAEEYYDLEDFRSNGTTDVQVSDASQLYVYDGSDGTSLVFLHDEVDDGQNGGAVTFDVSGLPMDGDWTVEDDDYAGRDDRFTHSGSSSQMDWMWAANRTDGGMYVGLESGDWSEITVDPAFGEDSWAATGGDETWPHADEGPNEWLVRNESGATTRLDMDESISIREGDCDAVSPTAGLSGPDEVATGSEVTFDATEPESPTSPIEYAWDFQNDGEVDRTTTSATVEHQYDRTGETTASVTVTDRFGNTDTDDVTVEVTDGTPPSAELSAPEEVETNEIVTFDASGSSDDGNVSEYRWDLDGDGNPDETTTNATHEHSFTEAGDHAVTVAVADEAGNEATANATVHVIDETPPNAVLSAPESATVGSNVTLDASESTDNVGIVRYEWTFDDGSGTETTEQSAFSHTYETTGNYTAAVTVVDVDGNTDTANATVAIEAAAGGNNTAPTASVDANETTVSPGQPVGLDGSASIDPDGVIVGYSWDFGDDNDGAGNTTEHAYEDPGNYTVTITVTDDVGANDTAEVSISVVNEAPAVSFTSDPTSPEPGQEVTFDASGTTDDTGVDSYQWDFGDGENATGETVTHVFDSAGSYGVTLDVTDEFGESTTRQQSLTVAAEDQSGNSGGSTGGGGGGGGGSGGGGAPTTEEPEPEFVVTSLSANRSSVLVGEVVTVNATVANRGDAAGSERFGPALERRPIELQEATLEPGESRNLTFTVPLDRAGEQTISVGDRETTVSVTPAEPTTELASLQLEDRAVDVGQTTTIVATVTNAGGAIGEHTVSLGVFGEVVDRKSVSVPPGETRTVRFTQQFAEAGNYTLRVGDRSATVEVRGDRDDRSSAADRSSTFDAPDTGGPTPGLGLVVGGGITLAFAALLIGSRI